MKILLAGMVLASSLSALASNCIPSGNESICMGSEVVSPYAKNIDDLFGTVTSLASETEVNVTHASGKVSKKTAAGLILKANLSDCGKVNEEDICKDDQVFVYYPSSFKDSKYGPSKVLGFLGTHSLITLESDGISTNYNMSTMYATGSGKVPGFEDLNFGESFQNGFGTEDKIVAFSKSSQAYIVEFADSGVFGYGVKKDILNRIQGVPSLAVSASYEMTEVLETKDKKAHEKKVKEYAKTMIEHECGKARLQLPGSALSNVAVTPVTKIERSFRSYIPVGAHSGIPVPTLNPKYVFTTNISVTGTCSLN